MKQKMVYYQDMFNPENKILGENKLYTGWELSYKKAHTLRYLLSGTGKPEEVCICGHFKDDGNGKCCNRTCRHEKKCHNGWAL